MNGQWGTKVRRRDRDCGSDSLFLLDDFFEEWSVEDIFWSSVPFASEKHRNSTLPPPPPPPPHGKLGSSPSPNWKRIKEEQKESVNLRMEAMKAWASSMVSRRDLTISTSSESRYLVNKASEIPSLRWRLRKKERWSCCHLSNSIALNASSCERESIANASSQVRMEKRRDVTQKIWSHVDNLLLKGWKSLRRWRFSTRVLHPTGAQCIKREQKWGELLLHFLSKI